MSIQEQRRKAFEEYFAGQHRATEPAKLFGRDREVYWNPHIQSRWIGWNAALDSVEIELPKESAVDGLMLISQAREVIEAAGLQVKP